MDPNDAENKEVKIPSGVNQDSLPEGNPEDGNAQALPLEQTPPEERIWDEHESIQEQEEIPEDQEPAMEQAIPDEELRPIVECLLFTTNEPLSVKKLSGILENIPSRSIRRMILSLKEEYDGQARGYQIVEVAGGFQMATRPQFAPYILKLNRQKRKNPLSIPALETLAIIAYKQPLTRAEIEAIRGVDSSGVLHNLLELGLIRITGRKEVVGHPPLYGTTEDFLKVFGLRQLADLPSIREIREMFEKRGKE